MLKNSFELSTLCGMVITSETQELNLSRFHDSTHFEFSNYNDKNYNKTPV